MLPRVKVVQALLFAPVLALAAPCFAQAEPGNALSLQEAVALATSRAANAEASGGSVEAARQMAVAAGQLPDPVLKLGLNNVPVNGPDQFSLTRDFMTMRSISLMQEFTRSDKRRAHADRFEAEAAAAEAQRSVGVANVQRGAAEAWLGRWYAERTEALLGHHGHPLDLELQAANAAYRSGKGSRADVLLRRWMSKSSTISAMKSVPPLKARQPISNAGLAKPVDGNSRSARH